jgi:AraC family transcriptional regulator
LVTAGSCDVRYASRGQSGKRRLSAGSLCFVTRGYLFSRISWKSTQCQAIVVDIADIDSEPSPIDTFGGTDALFDVFLGFTDSAAASLIRLMSTEVESGCPTGAIHGEALSLALASRIASLCQSIPAISSPNTASLSQKRLLGIARYVESNLMGDLSIDALAKVANMSAFHFARCFKNTTGLTPHQFVTKQRISTAKAMLAAGKHSIRDIAMLVGFSSHSHFAAVYRRITGVTPRHSDRSAGK